VFILYLACRMDPTSRTEKYSKKDAFDAQLVAKMESYQPLSTVKDHSALRFVCE